MPTRTTGRTLARRIPASILRGSLVGAALLLLIGGLELIAINLGINLGTIPRPMPAPTTQP